MYGVDVSGRELDVAMSATEIRTVANEAGAITAWLDTAPPTAELAVEATGHWHVPLVEQALSRGLRVYLVNGKQLHHYREAVGPRAKTDAGDAQLLRRYLLRERDQLRAVKSLGPGEKTLWQLLKRRAMLVKIRTQLRQSMSGSDEVTEMTRGLLREIGRVIRRIERDMETLARTLGWQRELAICRSIPGIGALNALALVACYHRGQFTRADQFIAFMGLDVRVRDSGCQRGKRKLTKRGESELRRLLYNAAMSFARNPRYRPLYDRLVERGLPATAAHVILGRKLARVAFALLKKDAVFDPTQFRAACHAT